MKKEEKETSEILNSKNGFVPKTREEEMLILQADTVDFEHIAEYLKPLIEKVLSRFEMEDSVCKMLHDDSVDDVKIAATRFLRSEESMNADYKFCTYFSWYIHHEIDEAEKAGHEITRKGEAKKIKKNYTENVPVGAISIVRYFDAYYSLGGRPLTRLISCESYGYAEKIDGAVIVRFAKGVSADIHDKTMQGHMIPKRNLISESKNFDASLFDGLVQNSNITVKWSTSAKYHGEANPEISIMKTEGTLEANENDRIVIKNPKTKSIQPLPEKEHPGGCVSTYYVIPKAEILEIQTNEHE
ncbi:MAG: hypothetical protein NT098_04620 [Candidatus Parcubacteria bacterium]|nr:hypothetical protein [Candidatus Parcubacteria bacterium]